MEKLGPSERQRQEGRERQRKREREGEREREREGAGEGEEERQTERDRVRERQRFFNCHASSRCELRPEAEMWPMKHWEGPDLSWTALMRFAPATLLVNYLSVNPSVCLSVEVSFS